MNLEPEQTMNSSAGDNSNAKYVGPFGPSPELFHPPRLGIIHLLAWTAVTAVLLKLMMALGFFSPPDELPRAMRIYSVTTLSTDMMILAAGVVGTSVILCSRLRCITGRLQAGHWMLVTTTVVSVFSMPLYLWLFVLNDYPDYFYNACQVARELLEATLWIIATIRMREAFRWRALLGFFAVSDVISYIFYGGGSIFIYRLFGPTILPIGPTISIIGSAIVFFALPLVVLIDLRHRIQRDWLHWLGVIIVFVHEVLPMASALVSTFLQ